MKDYIPLSSKEMVLLNQKFTDYFFHFIVLFTLGTQLKKKYPLFWQLLKKRSEFFLEDFEGKKKFVKFNVKPKNRNVRVGSFRQIFSARLFLIKNDRH